MTEAVITELTCLRCGRKWFPRNPDTPKHCPKCNSPYWNKPRGNDVNKVEKKYRLVCLRCGHTWESVNKHPTRCAKCKSPYWDKIKKEE